MSTNWAENPMNNKHSLMQYSLPQLLFQECHRYCVDEEFSGAETQAQKTCISNCQDKTYKSFELYMQVQKRVASRRDYRHYVDISKFTGMEVEHKHDTASDIHNNFNGHINPKSLETFQSNVESSLSDVKKQALQ